MKIQFNIIIFILLIHISLGIQAQMKNIKNDPLITSAVNTVDSNQIRQFVQDMQNMETRFMIAPNRKEVALWIKNKFESYNIPEVYLDSFESHVEIHYLNLDYDTTTWQYNVVARIPGTEIPEEVVIAGAHYDNVSYDSDPEIYAPGADDNASGIATLFETARIIDLLAYQPKRTIEFVAFAAEEMMYTGYSGAEYHAEQCEILERNIICMINNDMIAYNTGDWKIGISSFTNSDLATNLMASIAAEYTNLALDIWDESPSYGDCEPYWNIGVPCVYIMETEFNPAYHSIGDTIGSIDFSYCSEMIKATVGAVIKVSNEINILNTYDIFSNQNDIHFYPNPAHNQIFVEIEKNQEIQSIYIYSLTGELVFSNKPLKGEIIPIDLHLLKPAYYLMRVQTKEHFTTFLFRKN